MTEVMTDVLRRRRAADPDAPLVRCGGEFLSAARLDDRSDRIAAGLAALGLRPGDRVAMVIPNRQEMVELFFACAKLGAVQAPLNTWLKGDFLRYQLQDCGATMLIADAPGSRAAAGLLADTSVKHLIILDPPGTERVPDGVAVCRYHELGSAGDSAPLARIEPGDICSIIYTSGTTGMPKGCMLPYALHPRGARVWGEAGWVAPGDRIFSTWPLFHTGGLVALSAALVNDASVVLESEFHASTFIARAAEEEATMLWGVGTMATAILAQPERPSDGEHPFRLAVFPPLRPAHQLEFERRFRTPVIVEAYGQTEGTPFTVTPLSGPRHRESIGRPAPHFELRLVDDRDREVPSGTVGEIAVRPREPDTMFRGYWGRDDATLEAFRNLWYHTGDLGRADADGTITFVDRKKDALRRRGENVSCFELELAIGEHPAVAQAAVTGVPSPLGEDDIRVWIVPVTGATPSAADLFEFFRDTLPYFAIPRYVDIRSELPVNHMGRVMKDRLRAEPVSDDTADLEALGLAVARNDRRG